MSISISAWPKKDIAAVLSCPSSRAVTESSVVVAVAHVCAVVGTLLGSPRSRLEREGCLPLIQPTPSPTCQPTSSSNGHPDAHVCMGLAQPPRRHGFVFMNQ